MNDSFHSGEADPELVLEQLAHASDSSVSEVVNVIDSSHAVAQIKEIRNGSNDVVNGDVLGHQLISLSLDSLHHLFL